VCHLGRECLLSTYGSHDHVDRGHARAKAGDANLPGQLTSNLTPRLCDLIIRNSYRYTRFMRVESFNLEIHFDFRFQILDFRFSIWISDLRFSIQDR
ncbi:MAG: hypothetical protein M1546_01270, partial [Chloroflexi bacterium]|nr:hypothetical protein [Chloroflexota bacterium]